MAITIIPGDSSSTTASSSTSAASVSRSATETVDASCGTDDMMHAGLLDLPDEVMIFILQNVADVDLQAVAKVSLRCRRLASDAMLWKHYHMIRSPAMLRSRLFGSVRPDRRHLLGQNILRGVHPQQLAAGAYINGPGMQSMLSMQSRVEWLMREHTVGRNLRRRSDVRDLQLRNVAPNVITSTSSRVSNPLVSRVTKLKKALSHAALARKLQRRQTIAHVKTLGVMKNLHVAPSLVAAQLVLEKHFAGRRLDLKISMRQSVHELRSKNIFNGDEDNEQILTSAAAMSLDDYFTDDRGNLRTRDDLLAGYHRTTKGPVIEDLITNRPTINDLERARMIDARSSAQLLCPSVQSKIRQFDTMRD